MPLSSASLYCQISNTSSRTMCVFLKSPASGTAKDYTMTLLFTAQNKAFSLIPAIPQPAQYATRVNSVPKPCDVPQDHLHLTTVIFELFFPSTLPALFTESAGVGMCWIHKLLMQLPFSLGHGEDTHSYSRSPRAGSKSDCLPIWVGWQRVLWSYHKSPTVTR